jgi:mannitol/fructose-specific phosphotransferase system IIA component
VLVTTIVCLALKQEEQTKALNEIQRIISDSRDPVRFLCVLDDEIHPLIRIIGNRGY